MIYRIRKDEIPKAAAVMAGAFRFDPLFRAFFEDAADSEKQLRLLSELMLRYYLRYGEVAAPSAELEGVMAWGAGSISQMRFHRLILSGAAAPLFRMGGAAMARMDELFGPAEEFRRKHTGRRPHNYLAMIGVSQEHQGRGFGGRLLRYLTERSDSAGIPLYLETETERNVEIYSRFGFKVIEKFNIDRLNMPFWVMTREAAV